MKAFITGGGGFLGSAVARQLVERGDQVRSYSRSNYPELEKIGVEHVCGDLTDLASLNQAVKGCDVVIHVGAKAGQWGPYKAYYDANVVGTKNVIEVCRQNRIQRLIYTSSPSVVFRGDDMQGVNEVVPYAQSFKAPYPETKAIAEKLVVAANDDDLATIILRPHLIFGPGDPHLIPRIVEKARVGRLMLIGKGQNKIDVVYVDNAAKAHVLAADRLKPGADIAGKAYFISNGDPRPIKEIFSLIMDLHGLPEVKKSVPKWLGYFGGWFFETAYKMLGIDKEPMVTRFVAKELSTSHWFDISAARRDLGYDPEISIEQGLKIMKESMA